MAVTAYSRGHKIYFDGNVWRYSDTNGLLDDTRPCAKCKCYPTKEGYDACLGEVEGAISACCGHGVEQPYILWECTCTGNEDMGDYSRMTIFEHEGETYQVDSCMRNEIKWLLSKGVKTIESCCGHVRLKEHSYIMVTIDSVELMRKLGYEKRVNPNVNQNEPVADQFFIPKTK